jgi:class 3 adenylate cyclase
MKTAVVVFFDIVGFSKFPSQIQKKLVDSVTKKVLSLLGPLLEVSQERPEVIALPTGDGMALAFIRNEKQAWDIKIIMNLIYSLQEWASKESSIDSDVQLRVGVHTGQIEIIDDVNRRPNVCGHTINFTQRVMDSANARQVLFSDDAFNELVGLAFSKYSFSPECTASFEGPYQVMAKHNMPMLVRKVVISPSQGWWSNEDPISENMITVQLTHLPKQIIGQFSDRISSAENVALIQLTGDHILEALKSGKVQLSSNLKQLLVFMPDPEIYGAMDLPAYYSIHDYTEKCVIGWKKYLTILKRQNSFCIVKLGLFKEPPYFGASFVDWQKPHGKIHVSPYVWSIKSEECPGYELEWLGPQPPLVYQKYVIGLDSLNARTSNLV